MVEFGYAYMRRDLPPSTPTAYSHALETYPVRSIHDKMDPGYASIYPPLLSCYLLVARPWLDLTACGGRATIAFPCHDTGIR